MVSAKSLTIRHHIAHRNHKKRRSNTPTCEFCQFHTYVEGLNNHGMEKHLPIVQFVSCVAALCGMAVAQPSTVAPERELAIKTFGGYPVSGNISSLWLAGSDGRPLLMIYFLGPKDWYETPWTIDFKFEDGKSGWVELRSENATVRVDVSPETWEVAIQAVKFNVRQSNTFLVLHTGELLVPQKVIPLGVFNLPTSTDKPASVLLLRTHLELAERIDKESRTGIHASQIGKPFHHSLTPPCKNSVTGLRFPSVATRGRLLPSTYSLPCWDSRVFSAYVQ